MTLIKLIDKVIPFILIGIFFWMLNTHLSLEIDILITSYQAYFKAFIYLLCFILSVIGLTLVILAKSKTLSYIGVLVFTVLVFIESGYLHLNNLGLGFEEVLLITQNIGFGLNGQAILTYKMAFLIAALWSSGFLILSLALRRFTSYRYNIVYSLVLLISLAMVYLVINNSQANRLAFPAPTKIPALVAYTISKKLYIGPREHLSLTPTIDSEIDHIIWVVDESVRADHLGVNGYRRQTTPYLSSISNNSINFGPSSSASVCSDYSHFILMTGSTMQEVKEASSYMRKKPLIFQFARQAGYSPAMVYSPGYEDLPKGYLTEFDFKHIPVRYQTAMLHPELKRYEHDYKSIDYLLEHIKSSDKTYSYFLKYGSHFHYEDAYPDTSKVYRPTQNPKDWNFKEKEKVINSYDNSIHWSVDGFFKKLITQLGERRYLIIYTSDHGQNILDYPEIRLTHCVKEEAPKVMALVPMLMIGDSLTIRSLKEKYT